ncbi:MAG: aminopeptidase [Opitutales bacterium]
MKEYRDLAKILCGFSTKLKAGEKVLLDMYEIPQEMIEVLIEEVRALGAYPFLSINNEILNAKLNANATEEELKVRASYEMAKMKNMDAYIAIRGSNNIYESSSVGAEQMSKVHAAMKAVIDYRVNKTKWVVLRWPSPAMAQQAMMSTSQFRDFYFRVCTFDYSKFIEGMDALKKLMESTDKVEIKGNGTDLTFSIKNMKAIPCGGQYNIPDGEVFTAPIKDSVNGVLQYNAPSLYHGISFDNVRFVFKDGKIVEATADSNTDKLNEILDSDEGARYIGEFAIGFNPYVTEAMRDILFDEKIAGSFHFTPGQAYSEADNGNSSKIHWDLVCIQTESCGGGQIYFDGKLIRDNGIFVEETLLKLNPEYLLRK